MSVDGQPAAASPRVHSGPAARLRHIPALDGIRGLAVIAVLLFHGEVLPGGYLGVDAFFVLSGFLITGLLIAEVGRSGRVDLGQFWARRMRRLMPALLVMLIGAAAFAVFVAGPDELHRIRTDAFATLGYVANWRAITEGNGYWQIFEAPSPLEHTWSLAIEEQFYLAWPLVVAGVAWVVTRRNRERTGLRAARSIFVGTALAAVASSSLMWLLYQPGSDPSRVYMGTDTRAASILVGAALAAWVAWRGQPATEWRGRRLVLEVVGVGAAAGLALAWAFVEGQTPRLYQGGFLLCGLAAVAVIAAAAHPVEGPVARAMSWSPLRRAGTLSYGLYLWHWPVYVVMTEARTGLDGPVLLAARIAVSVGLALASYAVVETPVRVGRLREIKLRLAVPTAIALCGALIAVTTLGATSNTSLLASQSAVVSSADRGLDPVPTDAGPSRRRLLIVGDSVANSIAGGARAIESVLDVTVANGAVNGCALTSDVTGLQLLKETEQTEVQLNAPCVPTWLESFDAFRPQVVTIVFGNAAGFERFELDGAWVGSCDAPYARWYGEQIDAVISTFHRGGAVVTMATLPYPEANWLPSDARQRIDCMNALNRRAAERAGGVAVIDLGAFVCPDGRCVTERGGERLRPDGVHFGATVDGDLAKGFAGTGAEYVARWMLGEAERLLGDTSPVTTPVAVRLR